MANLMSEKQIEDVFAVFAEELIEPGLSLKARQFVLPNKLRMDLLFEDRDKKQVVVELKKNSVTREDVGQILEYAGLLGGSRVVLIAPHIADSIKKSFEHFGIGYIEFSYERVEKLHGLLARLNGEKPLHANTDPFVRNLLRGAVPEPLHTRTLRDGNIAFKVTFNDRGWAAPCSRDQFLFNAYEKKVTWCGIQAGKKDDCQSAKYRGKEISHDFSPCYDAAALASLTFSPGWNHGQEKPFVCNEAKVGKVALLTSRRPGEAEDQRFIFALLDIERVRVENNERWSGTEFYDGRKATSVVLPPTAYVRFWDHYTNARAPGSIMWGYGLFRYVDDGCVGRILEDVIAGPRTPADQKVRAEALLARVA